VVGWIIAKLLARALVMILHRVHFDHFVERGVVGQALSRSNYDASGLIAKIVRHPRLMTWCRWGGCLFPLRRCGQR
jgi:hypothetical protein